VNRAPPISQRKGTPSFVLRMSQECPSDPCSSPSRLAGPGSHHKGAGCTVLAAGSLLVESFRCFCLTPLLSRFFPGGPPLMLSSFLHPEPFCLVAPTNAGSELSTSEKSPFSFPGAEFRRPSNFAFLVSARFLLLKLPFFTLKCFVQRPFGHPPPVRGCGPFVHFCGRFMSSVVRVPTP